MILEFKVQPNSLILIHLVYLCSINRERPSGNVAIYELECQLLSTDLWVMTVFRMTVLLQGCANVRRAKKKCVPANMSATNFKLCAARETYI